MDFIKFLYLLLFGVLSRSTSPVLAACPQGFVEVNGFCVQQSTSCPPQYILLNGLCYPATTGQCSAGYISINGQCCSQSCIANCIGQSNCGCCPMSNTNTPQAVVPQAPCPNQPVAPGPTQPVAPCPNQPVAPCPNQPAAPCPTQPIAPCPNQPVAPCPNQPVAPCPNQPVAPCPTQPVAPCPSQPVAPCPTQPIAPCPNQPVAPCPNQPVAPCPNQPVAPCPTQPVGPCPNQPIAPCPNQPYPIVPNPVPPVTLPPTPPTSAPPTSAPSTSAPPTTIPTTTTTTASPPPAQIIQCPDGTVLVNGVCREIYCGKGIYKDKHCIQTVCPTGTVWTGIRCAPPEPIVHSITFNNTIITHFNRTEPGIVVNNVNNVVVNATAERAPILPIPPVEEPEEDCEEPTTLKPAPTPAPKPEKCCTVMTPRMCRPNDEGSWSCFSRRYKRCGAACTAPVIYLKAPRVYQDTSYVVMPPDTNLGYCRHAGACPESRNYYDCSGCAIGQPENCSSYCYNYSCNTRKCQFYDQREYCTGYGGYGCQQQDGCFENWCSG